MHAALRLAAACLLPVVALAADHPNITPGLWESTTEMAMSGLPPIPDDVKAKMPPEALARMEAVRGGGGPKTMRHCITPDSLDRMFDTNDNSEQKCQRTVVSQTATSGQIDLVCQGVRNPAMSWKGTVKWQTSSPTAGSATVDMSGGPPEHPMTIHSQVSSKWVSADCGDVKPGSPQIVH